MNGKENIINKILSDADDKCQRLLVDAEEQAKAIVAAAENSVLRDREALDVRIKAIVAERKRNRVSNAELDGKKYTLNAKQQLISLCYEIAYDKLVHFSDEERTDFIGTLIENYAEQGETVYITQTDAKSVTQLFLDGFDKQLKLGSRYIKADGGILLEGDGYEKDLTLKSVLAYTREQTEGRVAELLLGVKDE